MLANLPGPALPPPGTPGDALIQCPGHLAVLGGTVRKLCDLTVPPGGKRAGRLLLRLRRRGVFYNGVDYLIYSGGAMVPVVPYVPILRAGRGPSGTPAGTGGLGITP
jgi:hypothetical protein